MAEKPKEPHKISRLAHSAARASPFVNRAEAGRRLAARLARFRRKAPVVLALPRGGVPVAAEVASALGAPLDLVLVRKIGVPFRRELAMGAVADGGAPITIRNDDVIAMFGIGEDVFERARDQELQEIERRRTLYLGGRTAAALEGKTAIVVDDGVATGATTRAALRAVRARHPAALVLAVPVAPSDVLPSLQAEADETICLDPEPFLGAIGFYYRDFSQVSDAEVIDLLARYPPAPKRDQAEGT
jgi:predicted phosphoribosyltransferase